MSDSFEDRHHREPNFTSWWCVFANVIQGEDEGPNLASQGSSGTKHFLPGETIAILDIYPNDNDRVIVLGRHRETHHYIEIVMRRKWLTNFRTELIEHPVVLGQLKKSERVVHSWRCHGVPSKENCDVLVEFFKSQQSNG
jgi:hypothetical protein